MPPVAMHRNEMVSSTENLRDCDKMVWLGGAEYAKLQHRELKIAILAVLEQFSDVPNRKQVAVLNDLVEELDREFYDGRRETKW